VGLWFFVSFRNFVSDITRVRIFFCRCSFLLMCYFLFLFICYVLCWFLFMCYMLLLVIFYVLCVRERPFNFRNFVSDITRVRIFFCRATREIVFQSLTLGYMTKTLNQIFFSSTKIRIFFSATLGIRIFF
jgi:hypothetical protein